MPAAVEHIHHRDRQADRPTGGKVCVEGFASCCRCSARDSHRYTEDGIGAEACLVRRSIEVDENTVDFDLGAGIAADDGMSDLGLDMLDCSQHTFAGKSIGIAVALFYGFVHSGGSA